MSEIFGDNQKQTLKKTNFVLKSAFFIAVFILCGNIIALKTGLTEQLSKIFYYPIGGSVAGEYAVRIAAGDEPNWNPSYPRVTYVTPSADSYFTGCAEISGNFDVVGVSYGNSSCAQAIKNKNNQVIIFGQLRSAVSLLDETQKEDDFVDVLPYLAFRSDGYQLAQDVAPNTTDVDIKLNKIDGLSTGNGRSIIVVGPNKLSDIDQIVNYPGLDRFSYASIDAANTTLRGVGAGHVDKNYSAGDYVIQVPKVGGWLVNVSTRNPTYKDNIAFYINDKYKNVSSSYLKSIDAIWYDAFRFTGAESEFDNVDFNLDFVADTLAEKTSSWQAGLKETFTAEKQYTGKKYVITNDGNGVVLPSSVASWHDGFIVESCMFYINSWNDYLKTLQAWSDAGDRFILCTDEKFDPSYWTAEKKERYKNYFSDMRYGLTTNTMGDAFYGREVGQYYQINLWYDEYQTDLGYPKSKAQKINSLCFNEKIDYTTYERCPYVRFFDNGAAIVNPTFKDITIKDSDIKGLAGYAGPYYRFYGGQSPTVNNGKQLTDGDPVVLTGQYAGNPGKDGKNKGDGILLFKKPDYYVVADILVGNFNNNDTSPGSKPVETTGSWPNGIDTGAKTNPYFSQWNWDGDEGWGYFYTTDQSATATFRPTIGIGGEYEVFEWHGWANNGGGGGEATNVKTEIKHANGTQNTTINQRGNYGKWNSLGKFIFNAGTDGYVKISASGADGTVLADAVKFVFTGNSIQPPQPPPPPVCNNNGNCDEPGETNANCPNDCPPVPSGQCYAADHFLNSTLTDFSKFHFKGGPEKQVDFPDNTHARIHLEGSMNNPTSGIIMKNDIPAGTTDFEVKVERSGPEDEVEILFMEGDPDACKNFLIALHPVSFANAVGKTSPTGSAGLGCTDSNQCKRFLEIQYYGDGTKGTSADNLPGYPNCDDANPKEFVLVSEQSKVDNLLVLKVVKQGSVYDIYNDDQKIGTYTDSKNLNITKVAVVNRSSNSLKSDYATIGPIGVDCFTNNTNLMADLNCDGRVDVIDLGVLLSCWQDNFKIGCVSSSISCDKSPDINIDGAVNIVDFGLMLGCWGNNTSDSCKAPVSP